MASERLERSRAFRSSMGARVLAIRLASGMSQMQLAEALGVSFQQIGKYERGLDRVPGETIQALASALGVPVAAFFDDLSSAQVDLRRGEAEKVAAVLMRLPPRVRARLMQLAAALPNEGRG